MGLKPGQTNNLNGRPKKGGAIAELVRQKMNELEPNSKKAYKELLVEELILHALHGENPQLKSFAIKTLIEYESGKAVQPIEGTDGEPLTIRVITEDARSTSENTVSSDAKTSVSIPGAV